MSSECRDVIPPPCRGLGQTSFLREVCPIRNTTARMIAYPKVGPSRLLHSSPSSCLRRVCICITSFYSPFQGSLEVAAQEQATMFTRRLISPTGWCDHHCLEQAGLRYSGISVYLVSIRKCPCARTRGGSGYPACVRSGRSCSPMKHHPILRPAVTPQISRHDAH